MTAMPPTPIRCPVCGDEVDLPTTATTDRRETPPRVILGIDTGPIRAHIQQHETTGATA